MGKQVQLGVPIPPSRRAIVRQHHACPPGHRHIPSRIPGSQRGPTGFRIDNFPGGGSRRSHLSWHSEPTGIIVGKAEPPPGTTEGEGGPGKGRVEGEEGGTSLQSSAAHFGGRARFGIRAGLHLQSACGPFERRWSGANRNK